MVCFERVDILVGFLETISRRRVLVLPYYYYYASRNVAFKARKLRESIMEGQDSFIMRQPEDVEAEFGEDDEDVVADAGNNAN